METELLCQPECQGPSVTRSLWLGGKLVPGAPGEAVTDAPMGAGEGRVAFAEYLLCLWPGTGRFYTRPHFLLTLTLGTEVVMTLPGHM